jgi:hypothetical protein
MTSLIFFRYCRASGSPNKLRLNNSIRIPSVPETLMPNLRAKILASSSSNKMIFTFGCNDRIIALISPSCNFELVISVLLFLIAFTLIFSLIMECSRRKASECPYSLPFTIISSYTDGGIKIKS